ncbi:MAG: hypothetical protein RL653_325 [Pseudomonadota bacterium]
MNRVARWTLVVLSLGGAVLLAPSCGQARSCAETCEGCCDAEGICRLGTTVQACGAAGEACGACGSGQVCEAGACAAVAPVDAGTDAGTGQDAGSDAGTAADAGQGGAQDAGSDAGTSAPDAGVVDGGTEQLPTIPVQFGSCGTLSACGGSLQGSWVYDSYCLADVFAPVRQLCSSIAVTAEAGTVVGKLDFNATTVTRKLDLQISGSFLVPTTCWAGQCSMLQGLVANNFPGATCTSAAAGGCECNVTRGYLRNDTSPYTVTGSQVQVGSDTYEYCATSSTLQYRSTNPNSLEYGVLGLTRQ